MALVLWKWCTKLTGTYTHTIYLLCLQCVVMSDMHILTQLLPSYQETVQNTTEEECQLTITGNPANLDTPYSGYQDESSETAHRHVETVNDS